MEEMSPELRLATGVILAGGTGGERFVGTGFKTTRGAGASAAMKESRNQIKVPTL